MKKIAVLILGAMVVCSFSLFANTTTVNWGAQISNGVGTANGTPLPNGSNDLILLGNFNISNAMITANAMNEAFLMSHFTTFGSSVIGAGNPNGPGSASDGYWTAISNNSTSVLSIQSTEIYYWVFNSPSAATATQYGIFTAPALPNWVFPDDTNTAQINTTDLSQVPHDASGILFGSFGTGTSRDGIAALYNLAPIPEPSTLVLAAFGLGLIPLARLRGRKS